MRITHFKRILCLLSISLTARAVAQTENVYDCWSADEAVAAHIQGLQSQLMVQSLKCRDTLPATIESYDRFLEAKRPLIIAGHRTVVAHFTRRYGPAGGQAALTDYETRMSNRSSSPVITVAQCERTAALERIAMVVSDADLLQLAEAVSGEPDIVPCPGPATQAAMVVPVWPRPIAPRAAAPYHQPGPDTYPPRAEAGYAPQVGGGPAGLAYEEGAPVQPSSWNGPPRLAPASAPPPPAGRDATQAETLAALRAAVAALDRAAGTLQAQAPAADPQH